MPTLPNPGHASNPEPPYTSGADYPSDAELTQRRELAEAGLFHARELGEILDELGIWYELVPVIKRLEEL